MRIDFGKTACDYARYRLGFPDAFYERLPDLGSSVLDLGTGTGAFARALARRGHTVTGLDPAEELLAEARRLDRKAGVSVKYVTARAEETGLPDHDFDAVTAGQCWIWLDAMRATKEIRRVVRPKGRLVIANFDWLPLPGNVVEATEQLILKHNPEWALAGGTGHHPEFERDAREGGFEDFSTVVFDLPVSYSHEAWRGRIRASAGISATLSVSAVSAFDSELRSLLEERVPDEPLSIPHRLFAVMCRAP